MFKRLNEKSKSKRFFLQMHFSNFIVESRRKIKKRLYFKKYEPTLRKKEKIEWQKTLMNNKLQRGVY